MPASGNRSKRSARAAKGTPPAGAARTAKGAPPAVDGRRRRTDRTRRRILEALIALLAEDTPDPTADQIAQRAGVARRTLFHHYADFAALHLDLARFSFEERRALWLPLPTHGTLAQRVRRLVRTRARLFEEVAPVRRAALRRRHVDPGIRAALDTGYRVNRHQLESILAPELEGAPPELTETLDALLCWEFWDRLRSVQRLDRVGASRAIERLVLSTLRDMGIDGRPPRATGG